MRRKEILLFTVCSSLFFTGFDSTQEMGGLWKDYGKNRSFFFLRNEEKEGYLVSERKEEEEIKHVPIEKEGGYFVFSENKEEVEMKHVPLEKEVKKKGISSLPKKKPLPSNLKKEIEDRLTILKRELSLLAEENNRLKRMFKQMEERFEAESKKREVLSREEFGDKLSHESTKKKEVSLPNLLTSTKISGVYSSPSGGNNPCIFGIISLLLNGLFFLGFVFSLGIYLKKRKKFSQNEEESFIYKSIIRAGVNELKNTYNQLIDEFYEKVREETLNINRKGKRLENMIEEIDERLKRLDLLTKSTIPSSKPKARLIDVSSVKDSDVNDSTYNQIYRLSSEGLSIDEISKRTNMEKEKINLILELDKKRGAKLL